MTTRTNQPPPPQQNGVHGGEQRPRPPPPSSYSNGFNNHHQHPQYYPRTPARSSSSASLKGCCCCLFLLLSFLALLTLAIVLIILLAVKPKKPQFDLQQVGVQYMGITPTPNIPTGTTAGASLSLTIRLLFQAANPNKVGIKYGESRFTVMYRGIPLGKASVPGFYQDAHSVRNVVATIVVEKVNLLQADAADLIRDASLNDRVDLRVLGDVGAKIRVMNFDSPNVEMDLIKERPLEFIGDITDKKDFWKLAVRVQDKWTVVKNGKEHLELVIVDSKGHDVQVVVPTDYKANSDKILEPNTTYVLSNFQVMINNLTFKASDHKFHLKWTGGTTAVDVNVHNIPAPAIKFKSFAEIIAGKWKPDLLVNVIGVVQDMGYCQLNEGSGKKLQVNFTMRDLSDVTLNCTLWEDYAAKFIKYMGDKKQGGPVVVMLKYAKIKEEGRYPLTVSNTYGYTRLFINDNLPEINNFKGSLPKDDVSQSQSQLMCTQSYSSSQLTSEEDFLSNNMILPIANIIQLDQITYCVTAATIEKVKSTRHGWYYFACHKCPKIAKGDNAPYTCEDGHNTETEIVKYKLEMEISYEGEVVTFVFWDREVTQLLGVSASHLRSNMIQAGITNRLEYPLMMDGLAGKNFVAKVKWQPRWKTFSVVCLKVEPELFAKVITKFPNYQPASVHVQDDPTDDTIGDIQVQDNDHTVSTHDMSASSEYDPDSLNQITPLSKMKTVDASQNYESLSQLTPNYLKSVAEATPAQLAPPNNSAQPDTTDEITPAKQSSSKRVRLIKQEKK